MSKILIVLTSNTKVGDTDRPTGFYFDELAVPYWAFIDAGFDVDIASILGGQGAHDPSSLKSDPADRPENVRRFVEDSAAMAKLADTLPIKAANPDDYEGVFLPGGHGTMWDMPGSEALARVVSALFNAGSAVGGVCHGLAGLVSAKRADGRSIVADRRVNSFTDAEEAAVEFTDIVPFLLETRLRELGGRFESGPNFQAYAVRDGNLATGQNPASSALAAAHMIDIVRDTETAKAA